MQEERRAASVSTCAMCLHNYVYVACMCVQVSVVCLYVACMCVQVSVVCLYVACMCVQVSAVCLYVCIILYNLCVCMCVHVCVCKPCTIVVIPQF